MSFLTNAESFFVETEQDVWIVVKDIGNGAVVAEQHLAAALQWVFDHSDQIAQGVTEAAGVVEAIPGIGSNPEVMAAAAAATAAAAGLQKIAEAEKSGASLPTLVTTSVTAYNDAASAVSALKSATAKAVTPVPASTGA